MCYCVFACRRIEFFRILKNLLSDRWNNRILCTWIGHQFDNLKQNYVERNVDRKTSKKKRTKNLLVTIDKFGVHRSPNASRPEKKMKFSSANNRFFSNSYKCFRRLWSMDDKSALRIWSKQTKVKNKKKRRIFHFLRYFFNTFGGLKGKSVGMLMSNVKTWSA